MNVIQVAGLTKTYRVGVGRARVREMLPWPADRLVQRAFPRWWTRDTFNALEEVSFCLESGHSLGLVGHNGAGKTTMLKIMAGITAPTRGSVEVSGRVAALIDILVGFHPDLTGRENTYLLGAVYGFGRQAMKSRLDRILDFAEIDELADTPLKRYSTGMTARLGFAIIASLDPDIMLVDEVLAVGDASFQKKCVRWLEGYRNQGGTLVFISHNLALVRSMTERAIWLDHGKVVEDGPTSEVLGHYGRAMERRDTGRPGLRMGKARKAAVARGMHRWGAGGAHLHEVRVEEPSGFDAGWKIAISYAAPEIDQAVFCVGFIDEGGREIGGAASPPLSVTNHEGSIHCTIRPLPLRSGIYFPVVAMLSPDGIVRDHWQLDRAIVVERNGNGTPADDLGPVNIPASWSGHR